jgi:hypothetical protein
MTGLATVADAWVVIDGVQFGNWASTKSFSVAVVEVDERVSEATLEKHSLPSPKVERLMPPS